MLSGWLALARKRRQGSKPLTRYKVRFAMWILSRRFGVLLLRPRFRKAHLCSRRAVVVSVGSDIVGHRQQGIITKSVTPYLQLAGLVALVIFALDLIAHWKQPTPTRWLRWYLWGLLVVTLAGQYWLHPQMSVLIRHR